MLSWLCTLTKLLFLPIRVEVGTEATDAFTVATGYLSLAMDRRVTPIYALKAVIGEFSLVTAGAYLLYSPLGVLLAQRGSHHSRIRLIHVFLHIGDRLHPIVIVCVYWGHALLHYVFLTMLI